MKIARYSAVALAALIYLAGSAAQAQFWEGIVVPEGVSVIYDPGTGDLGLHSTGRTMTTFEAKSAGNLFIPENIADGVINFPSLITEAKLFKLGAGADAFSTVEFGRVLPPALTADQLDADMGIDGSLTPSGPDSDNSLGADGFSLIVIPEPSSVLLLGLGLVSLLGLRRRS